MNSGNNHSEGSASAKPRSSFSHYLPRLRREFYQADAVIFWTMPMAGRQEGWLGPAFHAAFREMMLHAAAREGLLCPAYCLMPDHIHLVWMGVRLSSDQRTGIKFLRAQLGLALRPARFQHQAHDHVLTAKERQRSAFSVACADYVLLNPLKAGLVTEPAAWPYLGTVVAGYPRAHPLENDFWPWFWERYVAAREPGIEKRVLPPREMEWSGAGAVSPRSRAEKAQGVKMAPTDVGGYERFAADGSPR